MDYINFYTKSNDFNSQYETDVSTVTLWDYKFMYQMPLNAFHDAVVFRFGATF